jgi:hypothetical protein
MISVAVAKAHCRVLHAREDDLIQEYIDAAITRFENDTERKLYEDQAALEQDIDAPEFTAVLNGAITAGILLFVGHLYTNRDMNAAEPPAIERLWQPYKVYRIA